MQPSHNRCGGYFILQKSIFLGRNFKNYIELLHIINKILIILQETTESYTIILERRKGRYTLLEAYPG